MAKVDPVQLDREADELHQQHFGPQEGEPPVATDTGKPPKNEGGDKTPAGAAPPKGDKDNPPATPPDTGDLTVEMTLENSAERIRNAQARMTKANQEAADLRKEKVTFDSKIAELNGTITQLRSELEALKKNPPAPANAPAPDKDTPGLGDDPILDELAKEYPSVVPPLLKLIKDLKSETTSLREQIKTATGKVDKSEQEKEEERKSAAKAAHEAAILKAHPDAMTIADSDDFIGWVARQSNMIKQAVQSGTAEDVIDVLNRYKQAVGITNAPANQEAEAATPPNTPRAREQRPSGKSQPKFTRAQIEAMSQEEFQRREKEIDEAIAAGLVA